MSRQKYLRHGKASPLDGPDPALGEFDGGGNITAGRRAFFDALDNMYPQVRESLLLRGGAYAKARPPSPTDWVEFLSHPEFAKMTPRSPAVEKSSEAFRRVTDPWWIPEWETLLGELEEWRLHWHLTDRWIWESAVWTLWAGASQWMIPPFRVSHYSGVVHVQLPFDLSRETVDQAERRLVAEFRARAHDTLVTTRDKYLADGAPVSHHHRRRSGSRLLHYEWLARHVVGYQSFTDIARYAQINGEPVSPVAVSHAVREKATLIGLSLLPKIKSRRS